MSSRPQRQNVKKPLRYQTTSSEEGEVEKNLGRKTPMEQPNSPLNDDIAELRGVLENDSSRDNMHVHPDPLINYTQSTTPHVNNTTHLHYTQPFTQTTFSPSVTSHAPTYTQLLNVNHTTHSNNSLQPINYAPQNYNSAQTTTYAPHTSTHKQYINSGLNTLTYDPKFHDSNIWPNESHRQSFVPPSQTSLEFYNVKPEIQAIHGRIDQLALEMKSRCSR
ncbi:uncharacterized protein LOC118645414 isoform X2 [Monomorium pharaonis]|uniref:uncharacterized protein LOC118645414 isoform X2 n=1 Tax=Monomorium pharaonis TaxID=307658 RepID=UPI0017464124|nr:uncharacterized protein LOC118645414 isoform X2 [Monomorium pharaonis]